MTINTYCGAFEVKMSGARSLKGTKNYNNEDRQKDNIYFYLYLADLREEKRYKRKMEEGPSDKELAKLAKEGW